MADKPVSGGNATLTSNLTGATIHLTASGVEITGGGYSSQNFGAGTPSGGSVANTADIVFGVSTGSWGSVDGLQIKKSGTVMYQKAFTPVSISAGYTVKFAAGAVTVSES